MTPGLRRAFGVVLLGAFSLSLGVPPAAATPPGLATVVLSSVGSGFAVTSQGPLDPAQFATSSPDPTATNQALRSLSGSLATYQRVWQDVGRHNEVQDLVVRLPSAAAAQTFLQATRGAFGAGEIVGSATLGTPAGAVRSTYFATTTTQIGVGQAISLRRGDYVMVLSIFSAGSANPAPVTESAGVTMATAQQGALVKASKASAFIAPPARRHFTGPGLLVAIALCAVVVFLWSRRTRPRPPQA